MRPPWELGKSLEELGYDRAFVRVYRALPKGRNAIRPKDYLTLGLKFAQEHAVTSAVYNEETFAVISALVKSSEVIGALNPGEYRFGGTRDFTRTTLVNLANEGGELLDASGKPARFSRFGTVPVLNHPAKIFEGCSMSETKRAGLSLHTTPWKTRKNPKLEAAAGKLIRDILRGKRVTVEQLSLLSQEQIQTLAQQGVLNPDLVFEYMRKNRGRRAFRNESPVPEQDEILLLSEAARWASATLAGLQDWQTNHFDPRRSSDSFYGMSKREILSYIDYLEASFQISLKGFRKSFIQAASKAQKTGAQLLASKGKQASKLLDQPVSLKRRPQKRALSKREVGKLPRSFEELNMKIAKFFAPEVLPKETAGFVLWGLPTTPMTQPKIAKLNTLVLSCGDELLKVYAKYRPDTLSLGPRGVVIRTKTGGAIESKLRGKLIRLAYAEEALRPVLLPLLKKGGWWSSTQAPTPGPKPKERYLMLAWRGNTASRLRSSSDVMGSLSEVEFYKSIGKAEVVRLLRTTPTTGDEFTDWSVVAIFSPKGPSILDAWDGRSFGYALRRGLETEYRQGNLRVEVIPSMNQETLDQLGVRLVG